MRQFIRELLFLFALAVMAIVPIACKRSGGTGSAETKGPVVLYTSVDEPYVRPLIDEFEKQTGLDVTLVTDAEASKSVGLSEKLRAEKNHPQADVWWSNECFLTINMADEGVLAPYDSPSAADIPSQYKDPEHRWAGNVLRVRVMVASRNAAIKPTHLSDLIRPELKGQIAIARPTAGTTGGHVAALYVLWGKSRADAFFRGLHDNKVTLVGGNSVAAESVARGDLKAALCDNDDAADASTNIGPIETILPDQGPEEGGTLAMPCTVSLVAGAKHEEAAKRLIDFLLSSKVDQKLIDAKFAWCSTRQVAGHGKFLTTNFHAVAKTMPRAIQTATSIMEGR